MKGITSQVIRDNVLFCSIYLFRSSFISPERPIPASKRSSFVFQFYVLLPPLSLVYFCRMDMYNVRISLLPFLWDRTE